MLGKRQSQRGQPGPNYAEPNRAYAGPQALGATMDSLALLAASFLPETPSASRTIPPVYHGVYLTNNHLSPFLLRQPSFC